MEHGGAGTLGLDALASLKKNGAQDVALALQSCKEEIVAWGKEEKQMEEGLALAIRHSGVYDICQVEEGEAMETPQKKARTEPRLWCPPIEVRPPDEGVLEKLSPAQYMKLKKFFEAWFEVCKLKGKVLHLKGYSQAARHCAHAVAGKKKLLHKTISVDKESVLLVKELKE